MNRLEMAQTLVRRQRSEGWAALNELFRSGTAPEPRPERDYAGELLAVDLAPGLTPLFQGLANAWMPWRGKVFHADQQMGENIFTRDSYLLARLFNPFYHGFSSGGDETYRAFRFRTYLGPGRFDRDRSVLKIDYDLNENPALTVRRVLDELVQLDAHYYLGKAHVHWWWGAWQTVAFFSLARH